MVAAQVGIAGSTDHRGRRDARGPGGRQRPHPRSAKARSRAARPASRGTSRAGRVRVRLSRDAQRAVAQGAGPRPPPARTPARAWTNWNDALPNFRKSWLHTRSARIVDNRTMMVRPPRVLAAVFLLAAIPAILVQQASAAVRPPKLQYEITTLPNGLTVVLSEDHSTPIVHLQLWYHVGSKNEKPGRTGFAHLFEHLMFKGSKNVAARGAHLDDRVGRRPEQRLHDRRRDGVLGDGAGAVPAADRCGSRPIAWRRCASTRTRSPTSARW